MCRVKTFVNQLNSKHMQTRFSIAWAPRREGCDESSGPMTMEGLCHDDVTTKAWRRPHWQRHDDEATTARRRSDDRDKPGLGVQPQLMTCHKPGLGAEPGLMTRQTPACDGRRVVVASSSHRCHAVVMPSVYRRRAAALRHRAAELSSSRRQHSVVVLSSPSL